MVVLVLAALGILSSLGLMDALQAWRASRLAEDEARARAAAIAGIAGLFTPADVPWLCLRPPAAPSRTTLSIGEGDRAELTWWTVGRGLVRGEVEGLGRRGGRHRRIVLLRADSIPTDSALVGCPQATRLVPVPGVWILPHPDG